jgi:hypothetical protein
VIDLDLLAQHGSTNERLREVFSVRAQPDLEKRPAGGETAVEKKERKRKLAQIESDIAVRTKFEKRIQARVEEGITLSLKQWRAFAAVDLAWDSTIITKMQIPLLMYAQGKINVERCVSLLKESPAGRDYIIPSDGKDVKDGVDVSRFVESEINLVRSVILRRWAAQKVKYGNLWPYYKVESRSTGLVGKLRADLVSQRMDIMTDQFGYRRHDGQVMLNGLLYGHAVDFPRCAWEIDRQWRANKDTGAAESYIEREGIGWFSPHPSRLYYDTNHPMSSLNSDSGCEFVGFWDVMRFSEIEDNPHYFNKDTIGISGKFWGDGGITNVYKEYFTQYSYTILAPQTGEADPAKANDRKATVGFYNGNHRDASVFVTNHYEKIVPKDHNIGEYPFPVWARFVVGSNNTVMYAEFLPSRPGAVLSINESDARSANVSMAMDVLQFQQHMTNLVNHLMSLLQIESFKAIGINTDALEAKEVKEIRKQLNAEDWSSRPLIYEYSMVTMQERLQDLTKMAIKDIVTISETRVAASISVVFESMIKLMTLVERLISMSPAENGQPAPREISATEVNEIANTTSSVYSAISDDIDEFREGKKIIIYESLISCSKAPLNLPVKDRYSLKTVKAAGLNTIASEDEDFSGDVKRRTITGSIKALGHNFIFSSRDGSERPVNTQAANTMVQLVGQVLAVPAVAQKVGKEKLYEIFNEIFRMSGAGIDLNLQLEEGEDNSLGEDEIKQLAGLVDQIQKVMQQLAMQTQKNAQDIAGQQQLNDEQQQAIASLTQLAGQVKTIAEKQAKQEELPEITYNDAPDEVKAQIELRRGFVPARNRTPSTKKSSAVKP